MEAPTLSKRQQEKALKAKKSKRETIKNVLLAPHSNYWPVITDEDNKHFTKILQLNLPRIKYDKIKVPWKEIRKIPQNERKEFRENYTKSETVSTINRDESEGLVIGVNDVSKLLEERQALSILIAGDVQPRLMVQHITDQAVLYHIPLIVLPNLREILKTNCGVSSSTIAFSNCIKPQSKLAVINDTINNLSENYPVPKNHMNYDRAQDIITIPDDAISIDDSVMEVVLDHSDSVMEVDTIASTTTINNNNNNEDDNCCSSDAKEKYLKRSTNRERVFKPKLSKENSIIVIEETNNTRQASSFLPNRLPIKPIEKSADKRLYKSLVIRRLKGNNQRRNKR